MMLLVGALLVETTIVSTDCENCNHLFHNFSTNCTANFYTGRISADDNTAITTVAFVEEIVNIEPFSYLQNNTILDKTARFFDDNYLNEITFIGDSRFVGLENHGIDPQNIFAKSGLNHKQALTEDFVTLSNGTNVNLATALNQCDNEIFIINFGVNGAGWFGDNEFISNYYDLLDIIIDNTADDVTIVVQSILPISASYELNERGFPNERVDELNEFLIDICNDYDLYYLDSSVVMKDENNDLKSSFTSDGLHFNSAGYDVLLQHIENYSIYK